MGKVKRMSRVGIELSTRRWTREVVNGGVRSLQRGVIGLTFAVCGTTTSLAEVQAASSSFGTVLLAGIALVFLGLAAGAFTWLIIRERRYQLAWEESRTDIAQLSDHRQQLEAELENQKVWWTDCATASNVFAPCCNNFRSAFL